MDNLETSLDVIRRSVKFRQSLEKDIGAYRLFNGFYEGILGLVLDRYGSSLIIFNHGLPGAYDVIIKEIADWALSSFGGLESVLVKQRQHPDLQMKKGTLIVGEALPESISEFGVKYALDLQMNQDAGFYLDTRNLRKWLFENMSGKRVLNTFAYTGSLGIAAGAGGAKMVVQTDLSEKFLEIARNSWELNALKPNQCQILPGDFFRVAGRMRNADRLFDCVILDPPFFSTTSAGRVEIENEITKLINKVRPLVAHEGWLVVINNALFLSGADFMAELEALCQSDYLSLAQTVSVPPDVTGYPQTLVDDPPANPAPFNHPSKMAVLHVTRKDKRL